MELEQKECRNKWQAIFPAVKSVAPSCVLRWRRKNSVGLKETNRCDRVHHSENTCHLSSLGNLDLTRICKELAKRFAMNLMQGMQNTNKQKRNLDEVFFERETNMHETNARAQRNTRELHLELGGDKVTYVRVY